MAAMASCCHSIQPKPFPVSTNASSTSDAFPLIFSRNRACAFNSLAFSSNPSNTGMESSSPNAWGRKKMADQASRRSRCNGLNAVPDSELQTQPTFAKSNPMESTGPFPSHRVTVYDRKKEVVHEFFVPEDQYILHTAEAQDITLPFACRHGCCTSCAVRVKSGQIRQPEALGISAELKEKGYALLCVGFPTSDLEVETQDEDEVYWLQFGRYFARGPIERDDYAFELALADE